jgi:hypothetical protein
MKLIFHTILPFAAWMLWLLLSLQNFAIPAALGRDLNWQEIVWSVFYAIPLILFFTLPLELRISIKCIILFGVFMFSQILRQSLIGSRDTHLESYVIALQSVVVVIMGFRYRLPSN